MCRLIETLKIKDGIIFNPEYHNNRMNLTRQKLFDCRNEIDLAEEIPVTDLEGLVKCRVLYHRHIHEVQFVPYTFPVIRSLKLVWDDHIEYVFKYEDRRRLKALFEQRGAADDILIVKNGQVTDSCFCNVVFERSGAFYTPSSCLLKGTKRQQLLETGKIKEQDIRAEDIRFFDKVYLINAMIDLEDDVSVAVKEVSF